MTNWINIIWVGIQVLFGYNLMLPILLFLFWKFKNKIAEVPNTIETEVDYAIIVTAFQQIDLLPSVINSILKLNYSNYLVYVVADNCAITDLNFNSEKVILLKPEHILASNTASHFYAIDRFLRPHKRLTIIDSDNLVHPEYLNNLNLSFSIGLEAVQGLRKPKNLNSTYACLDAARDIYYHFYDGKLLYELNSSATLSGSGMAFTTQLYKKCLENQSIAGAGFDKVLQHAIVGLNHRIAFNEHAIVYDEKTSKSDQLVKQRARWINTWFKYFGLGFNLLKLSIVNRSINQFLFGVTLLRPPLFIFIIISVCFLCFNLLTSFVGTIIWTLAFISFLLGFLIALKYAKADKRIYSSLKSIPKFIYFQIISLMNSRNANKSSIATTHYHDEKM